SVVSADSSSSEGNVGLLGLLFFLSGFVFYAVIYFGYRNSDKRYHYESSTDSQLKDLKVLDEPVRRLTGLSNSRMEGANNLSVRGAPTALPASLLNRFVPPEISKQISSQIFKAGK